MEWISVDDRLPYKEKYYRCICAGFSHPIHCKFLKGKNGPDEYRPGLFIHKGRVPFVIFWKDYTVSSKRYNK